MVFQACNIGRVLIPHKISSVAYILGAAVYLPRQMKRERESRATKKPHEYDYDTNLGTPVYVNQEGKQRDLNERVEMSPIKHIYQ